MSGFTVRLASLADNEAIREIYNDAVVTTTATLDTEARSQETQAKWWEAHGGLRPVVVAEGPASRGVRGILGFASLNRWSDKAGYDRTAELSIYVHSSERGQGVGGKLLPAIIAAGRAAGLGVILSRITTESVQSLAMHDRAGFRRLGTLRATGEKFGRALDVMIFELALKSPTDLVLATTHAAPPAPAPALLGVGHVQLTIPRGEEPAAREFYCKFLGVPEIAKAPELAGRGGFWLQLDSMQIHIGAEGELADRADVIARAAATKAHVAWEVRGLDAWRARLGERGVSVKDSIPLAGIRRFEFRDPFGNRVEFYERGMNGCLLRSKTRAVPSDKAQ